MKTMLRRAHLLAFLFAAVLTAGPALHHHSLSEHPTVTDALFPASQVSSAGCVVCSFGAGLSIVSFPSVHRLDPPALAVESPDAPDVRSAEQLILASRAPPRV